MTQLAAEKKAKRIMMFGKDRFIFAVTSRDYAVHFWCERVLDDPNTPSGGEFQRSFGGIEYHWPMSPKWGKREPDHNRCWITGKPCWHDGSSLQASEVYIPMFRMCNETGDFEPLWNKLERSLDELIKDDQANA